MLRALAHSADGMPPTYYLLAQLWQKIFGGSILSLRLFSSLALSLGAYGVWAGLRRAFSAWASALAVTAVFCGSEMFLFQNHNLRPYGLFIGISGLAFWLYSLAADKTTISPGLFAATAACHAVLVLCHPFGIVYSGLFLAALLISNFHQRRMQPRAYAAIAAGWLAFVPWVIPSLRLAGMTESRTWVEMPNWQKLLDSYGFQMTCLPVVLAVLVLVSFAARGRVAVDTTGERRTLVIFTVALATGTALSFSSSDAACIGPVLIIISMLALVFRSRTVNKSQTARSLFYLAVAFLLVPVAIFTISHVSAPLFVSRYWAPSYIAVAVLLAAVFEEISVPAGLPRYALWSRVAWTAMLALILVLPVRDSLEVSTTDTPRVGGVSRSALQALVPGNEPVVIEDPLAFLPLTVGSRNPTSNYFYLLDRQATLNSKSERAFTCFKMLQVWLERGYLRGHILPAQSFLAAYPDFLVLHTPGFAWFEMRLAHDVSYHFRVLGQVTGSTLVEVKRCAPADKPDCLGTKDAPAQRPQINHRSTTHTSGVAADNME